MAQPKVQRATTAAPQSEPELAGIVLALGAPREAIDAVRSLQALDPPVEIVVVNSGGGDMAAKLRAAGIEVPVIERQERLFVGASRNLGIAATKAPYIGFLASDCRAAPGWSRYRIVAHRAGKATVASALIPSHRWNPFAWASHLALFRRRLPGTRGKAAALYGASYDRSLFERYGLFRADLRVAEDTEFHARLSHDEKPVWRPRIRAIHASPTGPISLFRDQYNRGGRAADASFELSGKEIPFNLRWTYMQVRSAIRMSRQVVERRYRPVVYLSWLLLPLAVGGYALGGAAANRRRGKQTPPPA